MTIVPILNIGREKMGAMGNLPKSYDGVYVCICTVYSYDLKKLHNTHSSMTVIFQKNRTVNAVVQLLIKYHMYPSVY